MARRRILLLITDLQIGGTPTVVRELATRLRGHVDVEVASLKPPGPVADQLRSAGITVTAFNAARSWQLFPVVKRLRRLVRERQIDVVFSFLVHANLVGAVASRGLAGVRFIQSIQTTQPNPSWHWRVQRWAAKYADTVVVPSPSAAAVARDWAGVPGAKVLIIPNAVDPPAATGAPRPVHDPFAIGFVGRLDPVKRVDSLVEAYLLLRQALKHRRSHLHIFGDGPERANIQSAIARAGLGDYATLHGLVQPQAAYEQLDLLVLPSIAEGFGLVLIEAMAAGVAVAGSDVPGIRDVIRDGETGVLFDPHSPAAQAEKLLQVIENDTFRSQLVAAARLDVASRFCWSQALPQYLRLLGV